MSGAERGRQQTAQQAPPSGIDLSDFPDEAIPTGTPLYRAHSATDGPWWFASNGGGRFDLTAPRGTCYAADEIAPALRERLGLSFAGGGRAPAGLVDATTVTEIVAPGGRAANLEALGVAAYPITGELVNMNDYAVPQAWASAFDAAGFSGIHYRGRFSHSYGVACWALFGDAGAHASGFGSSFSGREACARAGIAVMPPPPTDASTLRISDPPA